jgi:hypothetical protein
VNETKKEGVKNVVFDSDFDFEGVANRSCGSEVGKSLFQGKIQDPLLHNVFREAKYLS